MFNSIQGEITHKGLENLYLQSGDLEWDLSVTAISLQTLPALGQRTKVYTYLLHTEDQMKYFAFSTTQERALFLDLIKVNGVGPKAAMKFLSGLNWKDFVTALETGDTGRLSKVPGMGLKTAQKVVLALKGKLQISGDSPAMEGNLGELIHSLTEMGFDRKLVEKAVSTILPEVLEVEESKKEKIMFQKALSWLTGVDQRGR